MTSSFAQLIREFRMPHPLPWRWIRLPLLLASVGLGTVCLAVCGQAIRESRMLENMVMMEAAQEGVDFTFDFSDIRSLTDVLTVVAILVIITASTSAILLASDWLRVLLGSKDTKGTGEQYVSTRSLKLQAYTMSFLCVWLISVLIPTTIFVRTRAARTMLNGQPTAPQAMFPVTEVDPFYWDHGFLRCLAAAPWFTFVFAFPTTLATWAAWHFASVNRRIEALHAMDEKGKVKEVA